jgi:dTDP-4-dehydrorhamnose reductase
MTENRADENVTPELWGGVECTVHRVGDRYGDQLQRSGHAARVSDIALFAALGFRTLRAPFLWERIAPAGCARADWQWADRYWDAMSSSGIRPIVGLVHHGSGPPHTSLLDESFAEGLADYAAAFARRYPSADAYTPVNEPGTTARFSALYGHWYPHTASDRAFARALIVQSRATVLAMRAIRQINPSARLVQTEDLGCTFATPLLTYQAEFQNERRWLAIDLLCGRVDRTHPLWGYLRWTEVPADDLAWFLDHPCPPDVIGVNYYLTSDRFLDDRLERYAPHLHGGNGRHAYADTEAVRVRREGLVGHRAILTEASERYARPVALTEVHAGGAPAQQVRWLVDAWIDACAARRAGVPVVALTAWALLGSYDWDSLLTRIADVYEPGAFDVRGVSPRLTVVGRLIQTLHTERRLPLDLIDTRGWWRSPVRLRRGPERVLAD